MAQWTQWVEGDLGMPDWVHLQAGIVEVAVLWCRYYWDWIVPAHVVTCGMMGGALATWIGCVVKPVGVIPGLLVLAASTIASWEFLGVASHCFSLGALLVGFMTAEYVHREYGGSNRVVGRAARAR